ncbi:hypothetical protein RHMOL_Rhmol01G0270400 [Rhododendron molle]|nr:hypothetical protein RHMOL_Rhmol01G0270400 [Rhododendron molle]
MKCYVGGQISYSDYEDRDRVSILDLKEIAKKCGLTDVVDFYYNVPSSVQDGGFIIMQTDNHIMDMVRHIKDNVVEIFLVISSGLEDVDVANWDWECGNFPESGNTIERLGDVADDGMQGDVDSESDANYDIFIDSDYDLSDEDDRMYEENVDVNTEWAGSKNSMINGDERDSEDDLMYEGKEEVSDSDDGFSSLNEAEWEDEQRASKAQVFRSLKGKEEPVFCMGMLFRNRAQLAGAIRQHSILQGREIRFLKNETTRVRAKCKVYKEEEGKVDCTWEISATNRATSNKTLKVVAYNPNHNCGRIWDNKLMNSSWLARIYFDDIRISPSIKTKELVEKHLIRDIQIVNEPTWTIISDKQKGLENAIKELLPSIEHRHCVRHLHNNFKNAGFPGQVLHDKMWNLATASYVGKFNFLMEELKKEDLRAFTWLSHQDRNPCHWSRSHFILTPKCDILLNNLCEPFNKAILCARDKPILTMLERLRTYFMNRLEEKRKFATKWVDDLGPKIHKKIEKIKKYGDFIIVPCGGQEFEARAIRGGQYTVNLQAQTCSCRRWDLTGIPCEHAATVIAREGGRPEDYVSAWYHKHSFLASYNHIMHPMNGSDMWEKSGKPPIEPTEFTRQPGRPKKASRREPDEPPKNQYKLGKIGVKMTCRRCGT